MAYERLKNTVFYITSDMKTHAYTQAFCSVHKKIEPVSRVLYGRPQSGLPLPPSILTLRCRKAPCHPNAKRRADAPCIRHIGVLLRIGFTLAPCYHAAGELLPRLFILTALARRLFSVALSRRSPSADVIRYPCPVKPGLSSR